MARSRNNALEFSSAGSVIAHDGDTKTGSFGAIQLLQDTKFSALTAENVDDAGSDLLNTVLGAGLVIYGQFTSVTIATTGNGGGLVALHRV